MTVRRSRRKHAPEVPTKTAADFFKARLGWQNTSSTRRCVKCLEMLPGSDFDTSYVPADTTVNICRVCKARPQASSPADAFRPGAETRLNLMPAI